jgi:predicted P-loop ATPase
VITLLFCAPGHSATKTFVGEAVKAYDLGYRFEHAEVPGSSIIDLGRVIESVAAAPGAFVIRGRAVASAPEWIRRTCKPKPGYPAAIEGAERSWVCWDFDRTEIPYDKDDPESAAKSLVAMFPEGLREASFVWQSSSSQHKYSTFRGHIWQYLDRPYSDAELKSYSRRLPFGPDRSLFNPVQPHYVAAPIFQDGEDPLPVRLGYVEGLKPFGTILGQETTRLKEQALTILDKAAREIKAIKAGEARHPVVNRWAYTLGQLCPHLLSELEVFNRIQDACLSGKDPMPLDRITDEVRRGIEDGKRAPKLAGEAWKAQLEYEGKDFRVAGTVPNAAIILTHDARWSGALALNERAQRVVLTRTPPAPDHLAGAPGPRDYESTDGTRIAAWLAQEYRARIGAKDAAAAAEAVAEENRFDPVREWLEELEWDGQPRLDTVAINVLGAREVYEAEIFAKFCIGAVARAYEPGCKVDATMVLEGLEGVGKSTFLESLAGGKQYYASIQVDLSSKDAIQYIHGPWLCDFSEIAAFKKTSNQEALKDFLSRGSDHVRLPYKAIVVDLPRRCVFVATTNEAIYLASRTGNRRIRPIKCHTVKPLSEALRNQIWAEARYRYLAGEDVYTINDQDSLTKALKDRELDSFDAWHEEVERYLKKHDRTSVADILTLAVALPTERQDNRAQQRVVRILLDLGWLRTRAGGSRTWSAPPGWLSQTVPLSN